MAFVHEPPRVPRSLHLLPLLKTSSLPLDTAQELTPQGASSASPAFPRSPASPASAASPGSLRASDRAASSLASPSQSSYSDHCSHVIPSTRFQRINQRLHYWEAARNGQSGGASLRTNLLRTQSCAVFAAAGASSSPSPSTALRGSVAAACASPSSAALREAAAEFTLAGASAGSPLSSSRRSISPPRAVWLCTASCLGNAAAAVPAAGAAPAPAPAPAAAAAAAAADDDESKGASMTYSATAAAPPPTSPLPSDADSERRSKTLPPVSERGAASGAEAASGAGAGFSRLPRGKQATPSVFFPLVNTPFSQLNEAPIVGSSAAGGSAAAAGSAAARRASPRELTSSLSRTRSLEVSNAAFAAAAAATAGGGVHLPPVQQRPTESVFHWAARTRIARAHAQSMPVQLK